MRLNKVVKSLAIALPLLTLGACSSSSDTESGSTVDTTNQQQTVEQTTTDNVQVTAAQRAREIEEQKQREMDRLRGEHIVYFDFDVSNVNNTYATILDAHAKFLNANTDVNVLIEGHADERGTPEYNIALGERRAKAVQTYLENMGVSSSQLSVVSYGEEKPMVKDRTESAFAKNRRAVLVY